MNLNTVRTHPKLESTLAALFMAILMVAALFALGCGRADAQDDANDPTQMGASDKPTEAELQERLTPLQYRVTQQDGTEPAFRNEYWDNKTPGIYVDVVSGEPLFSSLDKFKSGTGWPSFTRPLEPENIVERTDRKLFVARVEIRSKKADSHLGHVFEDGPAPTGLRYCMNSAALRFVPVEKLETEGLGQYLKLFDQQGAAPNSEPKANPESDQGATRNLESDLREVAILAGGCFWGMEELLREIPGVIDTEVGYTGGLVADASDSKQRTSKRAETVQVIFDPNQLTYAQLLAAYFQMHDPTTKNRQGNDIGPQYRSAIFTTSSEQQRIATEMKAKVEASGKWKRPLTTEIASAGEFRQAEDFHQDYLEKNPRGYTCHYLRDFDFEAEAAD